MDCCAWVGFSEARKPIFEIGDGGRKMALFWCCVRRCCREKSWVRNGNLIFLPLRKTLFVWAVSRCGSEGMDPPHRPGGWGCHVPYSETIRTRLGRQSVSISIRMSHFVAKFSVGDRLARENTCFVSEAWALQASTFGLNLRGLAVHPSKVGSSLAFWFLFCQASSPSIP